jgi:hypothetical protein
MAATRRPTTVASRDAEHADATEGLVHMFRQWINRSAMSDQCWSTPSFHVSNFTGPQVFHNGTVQAYGK